MAPTSGAGRAGTVIVDPNLASVDVVDAVARASAASQFLLQRSGPGRAAAGTQIKGEDGAEAAHTLLVGWQETSACQSPVIQTIRHKTWHHLRTPSNEWEKNPVQHRMVGISNLADEYLFHCYESDCGHEVVFNRADLSVTVLTLGDVFARHTGSTDPDILTLAVGGD